jgi:hypothetical protein
MWPVYASVDGSAPAERNERRAGGTPCRRDRPPARLGSNAWVLLLVAAGLAALAAGFGWAVAVLGNPPHGGEPEGSLEGR